MRAACRGMSPLSRYARTGDFVWFSQRSCEKRRIPTFFQIPLDNTSPDFSTEFSHLSPESFRPFVEKTGKMRFKKPLIYKVLHTFHRVFHIKRQFRRKKAVENFLRCREKYALGKIHKYSENFRFFRQKGEFPAPPSPRLPSFLDTSRTATAKKAERMKKVFSNPFTNPPPSRII